VRPGPARRRAARRRAASPRYRRAVPIWADGNLPDLTRVVRSTAVLAAVRDATAGTCQDESAAAPFAHGRWLFSHNGAIPDWPALPDDLGEPVTAAEVATLEARCDSVLLWLLLSRRLAAGEDPAHVLADTALRVAAARPGSRLNLLLTDGRSITGVRHGDTLWYRTAADGEPPGVLVASEPDDRDGWREAPEHSLLTATATGVRTRPLTPTRDASPAAPGAALPPAHDPA
ncbi:class II glutamine amidotransferase, partial [Streptomyces sp. OF3]